MLKSTRFLWFTLLLTLSLGAQSNNGDWKTYGNKEGNFSVLFPGEPQDSINRSDSQIQSHTLMVQERPAIYLVIYAVMNADQKVDDATYQVFKQAVFKELPRCGVDSEQAASPAINGYVGHLYELSCEMAGTKLLIHGNLYWGKNHSYAVMVMHPANVARPEAATRFVQSFSVLNPGK
jgi:hypothetical protein